MSIARVAQWAEAVTIVDVDFIEAICFQPKELFRQGKRGLPIQEKIERSEVMAFSYTNSRGRTYILHGKTTTLKSGKQQTIYFFGKLEKEGSLDAVPAGYEVSESKNGLPVLRKIR